ncbi:hypothetical protein BASA60_001355, partial [Batrachochytrium salamandrivorans]
MKASILTVFSLLVASCSAVRIPHPTMTLAQNHRPPTVKASSLMVPL